MIYYYTFCTVKGSLKYQIPVFIIKSSATSFWRKFLNNPGTLKLEEYSMKSVEDADEGAADVEGVLPVGGGGEVNP